MKWTPELFKDLNYATSSEDLNLMSAPRRRRSPGLIWSFARYILGFARSLSWWRDSTVGLPVSVLAPVESLNQLRVIEAIEPVPGMVSLGVALSSPSCDVRFPLHRAYTVSVRHLPAILGAFLSSSDYEKLGWRYQGQEYALTPGFYQVAQRYLRQHQPSVVLVTNDHNMRLRAFRRAAQEVGCKTVYIQHASVSEGFPPLETDFAFLDGFDALKKYVLAGPSRTRVFLTGSPLHDELLAGARSAEVAKGVGICLNLLDDPKSVSALVDRLCAVAPGEVYVRTHPRDNRPWEVMLPQASVVPARKENLSTFLSRVGIVLAGNSNVHLEAIMFGRKCMMVDLGTGFSDTYGFVSSGLVEFQDADTAVRAVATCLGSGTLCSNRPAVVSCFSAAVGTSWEGRSGQLIANMLMALVDGKPVDELFPYRYRLGQMSVHALSEISEAGLNELLQAARLWDD